ncbi:MAG: ABC transporter permease [Candidatus Zixiibacteriota bacterium]|nr:MAG: ABC transporter permease [candidate division Zixibacteria bacterium]
MRGDWIFAARLAFRSLGRNRKRSAITLAAVGLSVAFLFLELGFVAGLEEQSVNTLIDQDYGHLKIVPPDYDPMEPVYDSLLAVDDFPPSLLDLPGVTAAAPRLKFPSLVSDGLDQFPTLGYGLDLERDVEVFALDQTPLIGRFWAPGERGIVIGGGVAETFRLDPDSVAAGGVFLTLVGRSAAGAYGAFDLPVLGVIRTGYPPIDRSGVLAPLELAQELLAAPGLVSEITLRMESVSSGDTDRLQAAQKALQVRLSQAGLQAEVWTWRELAADYLAILNVRKVSSNIASLFFVLIAVMGVANSVLIAAFERTKEVGMLRALGMRSTEIMWQFLYEGAVLGLVGGMIGGALGGAAVLYLQQVGLNLTALYGDIELALPIKDVLYAHFRLDHLLAMIAGATLLSALAAYFPARRTAKLNPADALRAK